MGVCLLAHHSCHPKQLRYIALFFCTSSSAHEHWHWISFFRQQGRRLSSSSPSLCLASPPPPTVFAVPSSYLQQHKKSMLQFFFLVSSSMATAVLRQQSFTVLTSFSFLLHKDTQPVSPGNQQRRFWCELVNTIPQLFFLKKVCSRGYKVVFPEEMNISNANE